MTVALPLPDPPDPDREATFIAVGTTGIFCRPGCPAPAPRAENVRRLPARDALFSGYRPCLRCRPLEVADPAPTEAALRRAERLRPLLASARRTRRARRAHDVVVLRLLTTRLGPMLAGATDDGVALLEFADRPMLPTQLAILQRRLGRPLVTGRHPVLDQVERELDEYFRGERAAFTVPLVVAGTPFQERVWAVLRSIPPGATLAYEELAARTGHPGAVRAAGTANGANRLALLIPCHRVVRKSGDTGRYGGGRWRKAWLLAHEARVAQAMAAAGGYHGLRSPLGSFSIARKADRLPRGHLPRRIRV
ncbi:MAG TPA: methylated-DNA--[protein]-cysteine S-methyltransferase [candidate division Zixibacteria bacterium]|nr:methylated-DNA--[protein]-cysteine S-methyltransferase [candidate division Zixibacteria bacterium]